MPSTLIMERWHAIRVKLRGARMAAGLSQEQVAAKLTGTPPTGTGSRRSWLSRLEAGRAVPEVPTVIGYAHAVGYEVAVVPQHMTDLLDLAPDEVAAVREAVWSLAHGIPFQGQHYPLRDAALKLGRRRL